MIGMSPTLAPIRRNEVVVLRPPKKKQGFVRMRNPKMRFSVHVKPRCYYMALQRHLSGPLILIAFGAFMCWMEDIENKATSVSRDSHLIRRVG